MSPNELLDGMTFARKVRLIGSAILTVIAIMSAIIGAGQFFYERTAKRIAAEANEPVLAKLHEIQDEQKVMKKQVSILARAVNEPNGIKRSMLVEQVEDMNDSK